MARTFLAAAWRYDALLYWELNKEIFICSDQITMTMCYTGTICEFNIKEQQIDLN